MKLIRFSEEIYGNSEALDVLINSVMQGLLLGSYMRTQ